MEPVNEKMGEGWWDTYTVTAKVFMEISPMELLFTYNV